MDEKLLQFAFFVSRRARSFDFRPSLQTDREPRIARIGKRVFVLLMFPFTALSIGFLLWTKIFAFIPLMILCAVVLYIAAANVHPSGRWLTNRWFLIERLSTTRRQTLCWSDITSIERHDNGLIFQTPNEQIEFPLRFTTFRLKKEGTAFLNGLIRSAEANRLNAQPIAEARDRLIEDILRQKWGSRLFVVLTVLFFFVMMLILATGSLIRQGLDYLIVNRPEFLIGLVIAILIGCCVFIALVLFVCRKDQNRQTRRRWRSLCAFFRDSASFASDRDTPHVPTGSESGREPYESLPIRLEAPVFQELLAQQTRRRGALVEDLNRRERRLSRWALFDLSDMTASLGSIIVIGETVALVAGISILTSGAPLQVGETCFVGFMLAAIGSVLAGLLMWEIRSRHDKFRRYRAALCRRLIPIPSSLEILPDNNRVWTFGFQPDTQDKRRTMNPMDERNVEDNTADEASDKGDIFTVHRNRFLWGGLTRGENSLEDNEGIVFYDPVDPSQNLFCGTNGKSYYFDESANRWDIRPEQRSRVVVPLVIAAAIGLVLNVLTFFAHLAVSLFC